jgi:hypothetical protein
MKYLMICLPLELLFGIWHQIWHWMTQPVAIFTFLGEKREKNQFVIKKPRISVRAAYCNPANLKELSFAVIFTKNQLAQSCARMAFINTKKVVKTF